MDAKQFLDFLGRAGNLKWVPRHCVTRDGRRESVAEHCWRLALTALLLEEEFPDLDMNRVVALCLVHDLGEAVTGDIPTFQKTREDEEVEQRAVETLLEGLEPAPRARVRELFRELDAGQTPEARLLRALDKLEAVVSHNESPLSTWEPLEYDLNVSHGLAEAAGFSAVAALREQARQDSLDKIRRGE